MTSPYSSIGEMLRSLELPGSRLSELAAGREAISVLKALHSPGLDLTSEFERIERLGVSLLPGRSLIEAASAGLSAYNAQDLALREFGLGGFHGAAQRAAEIAMGIDMPSVLAMHRLPYEDMVRQMAMLGPSAPWDDGQQIALFTGATALSNLHGQAEMASLSIFEATNAFQELAGAYSGTLDQYRGLLDASGLRLGHWPKVRLLSRAEKRRRMRDRLSANKEPTHVRRAKSLVHRYERTLRELIDDAMADEYGEDWAHSRLPLCDCNDLLGRLRSRGGMVLDHADYAHYGRIVAHPDHFAAVFLRAFEDADQAETLFRTAGSLRAASHHARGFTVEDLNDLTLTWRTIETGLLGLIDDYTLDY